MRFLFEWDSGKATENLSKHGVSFDDAMGVFNDRHAITIFDDDHSDSEDRWITIGEVAPSRLLLVVHTHVEIDDNEALIRIISARQPTRKEAAQYRDGISQ